MKIFILEDEIERIKFFYNVFKKHELFVTDNINEAIEYIDKNKDDISLYLLDHDLGDVIDRSNNGEKLSKYMKEKGIKARVIIHSMNYIGAMNMMFHLPNAEYIPISVLMKKLK